MAQPLALLGGPPIRTRPFPHRTTMGAEERQAVLEVLDRDNLSGFFGSPGPLFLGGDKVRAFERAWAGRSGHAHAIAVNSWSTGLMTAVGAIGIEPGDEVICSPYSMSASATCALFYGGIPVFADIDPVSFCLDPASIERRITPRTRAIIVVHLFGGPADMDAIRALAAPRGIRVIEDAAQAPGVHYKGTPVGALQDIGGFSLNYHKHIHTGEGGMLVTNRDDLAARCQRIRNHGENVAAGLDDLSNVIGSNYRLTELQAAIGIEQLKKLDGYLAHRAVLAEFLSGKLRALPGLTPPVVPAGCSHAFYVYPLRYDEAALGIPRALLARAVNAELPAPATWECTPLTEGYVEPLYLNPIYQRRIAIGRHGFPFTANPGVTYEYPRGLCPVTERMYEREMLLSPLVREPLTADDLLDLARAFEKVVDNADRLRDAAARPA
jgi:dTDP-4-amino-4,6-dideoxygalactose transaminase